MRLNGWQRIWVCLFLLWTAPVAIGSYVWWTDWLQEYQRIAAEANARKGKTLAQYIRSKYPGEYDDLSDYEIETRTESKYPGQHSDLRRSPALTIVNIPDVGKVYFPRQMASKDVDTACARLYDNAQRAAKEAPPGLSREQFATYAAKRGGVREFTVRENASGQTLRFLWFGESTPSDNDLSEVAFRSLDSFTQNGVSKSVDLVPNYGGAPGRPPSAITPALVTLALWLGPPAVLYLCGLAFAWIRHGFREQATPGL